MNEVKEKEFKIPIKELFPIFEKHLAIGNNGRILFSGKFGIGKTYFLKEFFRTNSKYDTFHFSPVDYQINSNEDISEFLKYDILVELNKKNKDIFQEGDYNNLLDLQRLFSIWGKNNFTEIFKTGLSCIPKLGRPLKEVTGLVENFYTFKQEIEAGEKGFVKDFLKRIKEKNITEADYLSELLKEKIQKEKAEKQSILILDDLERIDPEHIFRILNIFSAHFDSQNKELPNKFGFDKIILVADVQNLKSIFHHKYG
ncbi:MAG: NTPase KAP, partial [Parcubacteria group bacterium]|nr:NTPase KAP [Parcubacteria group bacterium]